MPQCWHVCCFCFASWTAVGGIRTRSFIYCGGKRIICRWDKNSIELIKLFDASHCLSDSILDTLISLPLFTMCSNMHRELWEDVVQTHNGLASQLLQNEAVSKEFAKLLLEVILKEKAIGSQANTAS